MNAADLRIGREIPILKKVIIGMVAAGTLFTLLALFSHAKVAFASEKEAQGFETLRLIQYFLMISIVSSTLLANKTLKGALNPRKKRAAFKSFEARYYTASIIRLAGVMGNVFFAAVVLLSMPESVRQSDPSWYLHLIPLPLLWIMAYYVYPTTDKVERYKLMYEAQQASAA